MIYQGMKKILSCIIVCFCYLTSCSTVGIDKILPEYKGIDPAFLSLTRQYVEIAHEKGIHFSRPVTIGLTKIKRGNTIGLCHYLLGAREIDIDRNFWAHASPVERETLLWHELTHCFCDRDHDFGKGQNYPEVKLQTVVKHEINRLTCTAEVGYLEDGCPKSIMHPVILDEGCMTEHYSYYINEMFDRCDPW